MSAQECASALKIQDAWRKYQESMDSCPICLQIIGKSSSITECGHKFCTGCLLKAVQRNGSCPLCRGLLVENQEAASDDLSWDGGIPGLDANAQDQTSRNLNFYDQGYEDGRQDAEEEFQPRMREEIDIATQKVYDDGIVQGRSLASEDLRLLREKIKRLEQSNSRMREDLQFLTPERKEILQTITQAPDSKLIVIFPENPRASDTEHPRNEFFKTDSQR